MQTAQQGDRVHVHYRIRAEDGTSASSQRHGPIEMTVGREHPRLPGLGLALVGLAPGACTRLTVAAEQAFGLPDPAKVHRWPRKWFPKQATLATGKLVRVTDGRGRRRIVRVVQRGSTVVVVDTNHRWAGQTVELEVEIVRIEATETAADAGQP
jgi:FKBP-type peptidyl-prolyl cis-trans isomerase 2